MAIRIDVTDPGRWKTLRLKTETSQHLPLALSSHQHLSLLWNEASVVNKTLDQDKSYKMERQLEAAVDVVTSDH
ncbi:uncharacterized protein N7479_003177 [Penicillium vulpinum]|uniref:uncharacterized protein n=1 Tax=Penicillium vulpinum TaxID=29845 RepID=UPI0025477EE4|nr:uncharacterized protein N7479_003177 [Penicillium vulpinum]KAJ5963301.1 hypothetical protein N7479_003177 [Penicillium vulpinum]